ncbi:hypothetical protein ACQKWADRAFT_329932 [Trichoderma austrokoningii]
MTIQVGWSGGGHIKPVDQLRTIQSLMKTAAKFSDLVANTLLLTYVILTKYESLWSYMALKPLDLKPMYYENAAIYTNSMLDAYMDYKNIRHIPNSRNSTVRHPSWHEKIKGLDLDRRACRFQMVKIVKEVDQIEEHPDFAADETRSEVIQSTIIFRDRPPVVKDTEKVPYQEIFGQNAPYPSWLKPVDRDGVTAAIVGNPVEDMFNPAKIETDVQARYFIGSEQLNRRRTVAGRYGKFQYDFPKPLPIVPTVIYGFSLIDVAGTNSPRVAISLSNVTESGCILSAKPFLHGTQNLEASVMVLPNGKIPFQHGYADASDNPNGRATNQNARITVVFYKPFQDPPKAFVWFIEISQPHARRYLRTHVSDVTTKGMTVHIDTWDNREFEGARVAWLAWSSECDGKGIRTANEGFEKNQQPREALWYGGSFDKDPKVFCGINRIDFPQDLNSSVPIPIFGKHLAANKDRLKWHGGTWGDADMTRWAFAGLQ